MSTLKEIRDRAAAASPGPWMWRGNVDHDDPALSRFVPGLGRAEVLRHYPRERTAGDRGARAYAEYLGETDVWDDSLKGGVGDWRTHTQEEIDEKVQNEWVEDRWGQPHREARMAFSDPESLFAKDARELAIFEVCPEATSRDDQRVYRAAIIGIRHPDAEFIARSRQDVDLLLAAIDAVEKLHVLIDAPTGADDYSSYCGIDGYASDDLDDDPCPTLAAIRNSVQAIASHQAAGGAS